MDFLERIAAFYKPWQDFVEHLKLAQLKKYARKVEKAFSVANKNQITPDTLLDNAQVAFDWLTSIGVKLLIPDIASLSYQYELYGSQEEMELMCLVMPDM